jgi:hypothetical protein
MRTLTTLATAAVLSLSAATTALACSGYKNDVTAQTPMPQLEQQQAAATADPAPTPATQATPSSTEVAQVASEPTAKPN